MGFAENLKLIRKERNITQEELAELLGVSGRQYPNGNPETDIPRPKS